MNDEVIVTENFIDLEKVLAGKGVRVPKFVLCLLNRLLHVKELNAGIYKHRDKTGADFAKAILEEEINVSVETEHLERIPDTGNPIVVGNHPLGGPDGMALISAVGEKRKDIKFPVNDFLMYLPGLRMVFVPIDKVKGGGKKSLELSKAFAEDNIMLYFPAGLCSRRRRGKIRDMEWKPTVVKRAVENKRDIIPVFIEARNRRRFYSIANWRKRLGIKFNYEMALLPGEMFAQRGKRMRIVVGMPIPWQTFDDRHTAKEWAQLLREHVYSLASDSGKEFKG